MTRSGEILAEEFRAPLGVTQNRLATRIHVPPRLARFFGTSAQFWVSLQARFAAACPE